MQIRPLTAKLSNAVRAASSTPTIRRVTSIESVNVTSSSRPREKSQLEQYFPNIRPAVLPYYVGTDICHVPRIEKVLYLDSTWPHSKAKGNKFPKPDINHRFLERLFNDYELDYINRTRLLDLTESRKLHFTNFVAGRWAAKEAIIKSAPPSRRLMLQDVMIIGFAKTDADKPRGIILTTKCAKELEAIRKRNRVCVAETPLPRPEAIEQKPDSHPVSKDMVETDSKIRIGTHDIEGQEVRLSISHDGAYATAVAISPLDDLGMLQMVRENDTGPASRKSELEMDHHVGQVEEAPRGFNRHHVEKRAFKRLDLRKGSELSQTAHTLPGATH